MLSRSSRNLSRRGENLDMQTPHSRIMEKAAPTNKTRENRAVTKTRTADAETQRRPPEPTMLKHKEAVTVSGQSRHSQERNSRG
jgi:hypothetical protein